MTTTRIPPICAAITILATALLAGAPARGQTTTDRFELHNQPKAALHHLLVAWALADADAWPFYATPIAERATWRVTLDDGEAATWSTAVETYAATRGRSLTFDEGMIALRDYAAGVPGDPVPADLRPVAADLDSALPVYLARWWPAHDLHGRAWISDLAAVLDSLEEAVIPRIEVAYGGQWPDGRIPIDVVPYANDVGAYSADGRITVASTDPAIVMPRALELVFHEASHVDALELPLRNEVGRAFRLAGGRAPDRFWHDLIFYTTGEIVRIVLEEHGLPGYEHYGEATGVYSRGQRWASQLEALDAHWRPFLRSSSPDAAARRAALEAVARTLLQADAR